MSHQALLWIIFAVAVIVMLVIDLSFFNRGGERVRVRVALLWSFFWILLALLFNLLIFFWQGKQVALEFLTAYLVEKSLSVDNLFVFLLVFTYFSIPTKLQRKILFWGILGAVVLRGIFIFVGVEIIERFHFVLYVMGAFLVFTGIKIALQKDKKVEPEKNPVLKLFRKIMPVSNDYHGENFFVKIAAKTYATPLFVTLLIVETSDVVFAVDSIPAVFGITIDPFVVYTSNIFAILGLRALYFVLSGFMKLFHRLNYGLSIVLAFVGVKMLIADFYKMPVGIALGTIALILLLSILASVIWPKKEEEIHG